MGRVFSVWVCSDSLFCSLMLVIARGTPDPQDDRPLADKCIPLLQPPEYSDPFRDPSQRTGIVCEGSTSTEPFQQLVKPIKTVIDSASGFY